MSNANAGRSDWLLPVAFAVVLLAPFFILGKDSAIGWYDETDATLPWSILLQKSPDATFVHEWAGGVGAGQNFLQGNERISLLRMLMAACGPQAGAALFRGLFLIALMAGVYLSARRLFAVDARSAAYAAMFAAVANPVNYGWIIAAGSGWLAPFLVWFSLAVVAQSPRLRWGATALCAGIFAFAGNPVFILMCVPVLALALAALRLLDSAAWRRMALLLVVLLALFFLNYFPQLSNFYRYLQDESSRYLRFSGLSASAVSPTVLEKAAVALAPFIEFIQSKVNALALLGVGGALCVLWRYGRTTAGPMTRGVLSIALVCLGAQLLAQFVPSLPLAKLRWNVPLILLSVVGAWAVAVALSRSRTEHVYRTPRRLFSAAVVLIIIVNCGLLVRSTLSELAASGGWGVLREYGVLHALYGSGERFRVVSAPYAAPRAAIPPLNGVDAFDGMSAAFSWRRALFFQQMLQADSRRPVHTHRQGIFAPFTPEVAAALQMVNVGAVLSGNARPPFQGLGLAAIEPGRSIQLPRILDRMLGLTDGQMHLLPPLYVWRLPQPWSRVFVASNFSESSFTVHTAGYWAALKTQPRHAALFAQNDLSVREKSFAGDPQAHVLAWSLESSGFSVTTNARRMLLVINQVFDRHWSAVCSDTALRVVPVNGIMMAIFVPEGCHEMAVRRHFNR